MCILSYKLLQKKCLLWCASPCQTVLILLCWHCKFHLFWERFACNGMNGSNIPETSGHFWSYKEILAIANACIVFQKHVYEKTCICIQNCFVTIKKEVTFWSENVFVDNSYWWWRPEREMTLSDFFFPHMYRSSQLHNYFPM